MKGDAFDPGMRAPFGDISDWLVNADVSDFCRSLPCLGDVLGPGR
jgi:hypothetical protein